MDNKKKIGLIIVGILILLFAVVAIKWIKHRMEYAITDAVFVESDYISNIGFQRVSGKVIQLFAKEGDFVKEGQELAKIDDTDYKISLQQIEKQIESLEYQKEELEIKKDRISKELDINQINSSLTKEEINKRKEALSEQIKQVEAQINQTKKDYERYENLLNKGLIPKQKFEQIQTQLSVLQEQKSALEKNLEELNVSTKKAEEGINLAKVQKIQISELDKSILSLQKQIEALNKQKEDLENQINYTTLKAPFDGVIAKKFVSIGDVVKSGMPIYSVIKKDSFYINVLLEETKLKGIKKGSIAYIKLDAYPDKEFEGVVEEIGYASAATYALVPRDISAGEFTKVAQRIPVKIRITKGDFSLLRVGLGGEVEIKKEN